MFFLVITTNLTIYLSSFQLLGMGSGLAGGLVLTGGLVTTGLSALFYRIRNNNKVGGLKKLKKLDKFCDCDCNGTPDCCDCGCD